MPLLQGLRLERARASKQFRDGTFRNTSGVGPDLQGGKMMSVMGEFFFGGSARKPRIEVPVESPLEAWTGPISGGLRITWLGHSTMLLEVDGLRVLTDPVFGDRASPVSFAGPRRFHAVPATIAQLPKLDAILLSHDHFDHLCQRSIRELATLRVPIVTSLGVGARLEKLGFLPELITELAGSIRRSLPSSIGGRSTRCRAASFRSSPPQPSIFPDAASPIATVRCGLRG
jgi:hypothetical protein